jgi:methionyl-tRNA synthetase
LDEFRRLDLRIGTVRDAEPVSGSTRLLRLSVDLGGEHRVLVGALAGSFQPDELRGLQVIVVANLAPARIRGIESQGMLLGAGCDVPGAVALLTVTRRVPDGQTVT